MGFNVPEVGGVSDNKNMPFGLLPPAGMRAQNSQISPGSGAPMNTQLAGKSAVFTLCIFLFAATPAQALQPYQQEALEALLADVDPESRPAIRAQFEPLLAAMGPEQVRLLMEGYASAETGENLDLQDAVQTETTVASAEDLAYNRAQYEPVIRAQWQAQSSFDEYASAAIVAACGEPGRFAVWGSGWRHELLPMDPYWPRASDSPELDVEILGGSYAAQDGRYRYDFSGVRTGFDRSAVDAAVQAGCSEYVTLGQSFAAEANARIQDDYLPGGDELERAVNERASLVRDRLSAALQQLAPAADGALVMALLSGERSL